mmetsp:Transcript_43686/g.134906  ORF Transcript_43686/g.134906 Transcript_43686/m.134906 type:complete len:204 (+) Transcript_43686:1067-1678(+)
MSAQQPDPVGESVRPLDMWTTRIESLWKRVAACEPSSKMASAAVAPSRPWAFRVIMRWSRTTRRIAKSSGASLGSIIPTRLVLWCVARCNFGATLNRSSMRIIAAVASVVVSRRPSSSLLRRPCVYVMLNVAAATMSTMSAVSAEMTTRSVRAGRLASGREAGSGRGRSSMTAWWLLPGSLREPSALACFLELMDRLARFLDE